MSGLLKEAVGGGRPSYSFLVQILNGSQAIKKAANLLIQLENCDVEWSLKVKT